MSCRGQKDNRVDPKIIREAVSYDSLTGDVTWKVRPREHFATSRIHNSWNAKMSGKKIKNITDKGYITVSFYKKKYYIHRIAWFIYYGEFPEKAIDHINGNKLDNRIENLRDVDPTINSRNKKNTGNKLKAFGVQKAKLANGVIKFRASISFTKNNIKERKCLGSYDNLFDACCARKNAEIKYGFHENHGR